LPCLVAAVNLITLYVNIVKSQCPLDPLRLSPVDNDLKYGQTPPC